MAKKLSRAGAVLLTVLAVSGVSVSQAAPQNRILVVSGQSGQASILQSGGRSYVDVEDLARILNASLGFKGNQVILTPPAPAATATTDPPPPDPANAGVSKPFMKAGIEAMSVIREWRSALISVVQNGSVVTDDYFARYRAEAAKNVRLASVAVSTDSDRSAFALLGSELDNMQKLNNNIVAARKNLSYLSPTAVTDDPLDQQILTCARSMAAMATAGQFQDDGACH